MIMRLIRVIPGLTILFATLAQAQSGTLHGVEASDINRGADRAQTFSSSPTGDGGRKTRFRRPCRDGAGAGRQPNRRKDRLHEILDDVSALPTPAKGSSSS